MTVAMTVEEQVLERSLVVGLRELRRESEPPDQCTEILARLEGRNGTSRDSFPPVSVNTGRLVAASILLGSTLVLAGVAWLSGDPGGDSGSGAGRGAGRGAPGQGRDAAKNGRITRRVFRETDVHVVLSAIAKETHGSIVVAPGVAGTITIDIREQTALDAVRAVAAKVSATAAHPSVGMGPSPTTGAADLPPRVEPVLMRELGS